uniref:hypothetical protein n=1 Tax=Pantanalinema rosaneae TaxID=1620701 RepID=UPI003D6F1820
MDGHEVPRRVQKDKTSVRALARDVTPQADDKKTSRPKLFPAPSVTVPREPGKPRRPAGLFQKSRFRLTRDKEIDHMKRVLVSGALLAGAALAAPAQAQTAVALVGERTLAIVDAGALQVTAPAAVRRTSGSLLGA